MVQAWRLAAPRWLMWVLVCPGLVCCGCWWQKDTYTERMRSTIRNWERLQELDNLLGGALENSEFGLFIRPPKAAVPVPAPAGFLGLMQGGEPQMEVVVIGSNSTESLAEFQAAAVGTLEGAQKGPGKQMERLEPVVVNFLFGSGGQTQFERMYFRGPRPGGNPPADYHWIVCFTEDVSQKVMVAFVIPDAKYADYGPAVDMSLRTLALGARLGPARSGVLASDPPPAAASN